MRQSFRTNKNTIVSETIMRRQLSIILFALLIMIGIVAWNMRTYAPTESIFSSAATKDPVRAELELLRLEKVDLQETIKSLKRELAYQKRKVQEIENFVPAEQSAVAEESKVSVTTSATTESNN